MDLFAHLVWSFIIFGKFVPSNQLIQILFFSILPDLIWGIPSFFLFISDRLKGKTGFLMVHEREGWIKSVYYSSHSFVSVFVLFALGSILTKSVYMPLLYGWGLHLLFDMFLHKGTLGNKPLYPLGYKINGLLHWKSRKFLIVNWAVIAVLLAYSLLTNIY